MANPNPVPCTDVYKRQLADLHVVLAAHVFLNIGSQVVTGNADGVVAHDIQEYMLSLIHIRCV